MLISIPRLRPTSASRDDAGRHALLARAGRHRRGTREEVVTYAERSAFYDLVAAEWRKRDVPLMPPASETEVASVFADLGCRLSADVKSLYAVAGGFVDYEGDELWSFWSLERIRNENMPQRRPFVMFADWLISSHHYCFHYENPEISSIYISHCGLSLEPAPIAGSLAEFLEKLLCNPNEVEAWKSG